MRSADFFGSWRASLGQNEGELVSPMARAGVDGAGMSTKDLGHPAKRPSPCGVPELIIDFLQPVQVKQHQSKISSGSLGSFDLTVQHFHQSPVVGEARQGIAYGQQANAFE